MARGQGGVARKFPAGPWDSPRPPSGCCGPRLREGRPTRRGGPAEGRGAGRQRKFVPSGALRPAPTAPARSGPGAASAGGASSRAVRSPPSRGSWEPAPGWRGCAALLCAGRLRPGSRRGVGRPRVASGASREAVRARGTPPPRSRGAGLLPLDPAGRRAGWGPDSSRNPASAAPPSTEAAPSSAAGRAVVPP